MKDAISVLTNDSTLVEELLMALEALQVLVEPIDNANSTVHTACLMHKQHCNLTLC